MAGTIAAAADDLPGQPEYHTIVPGQGGEAERVATYRECLLDAGADESSVSDERIRTLIRQSHASLSMHGEGHAESVDLARKRLMDATRNIVTDACLRLPWLTRMPTDGLQFQVQGGSHASRIPSITDDVKIARITVLHMLIGIVLQDTPFREAYKHVLDQPDQFELLCFDLLKMQTVSRSQVARHCCRSLSCVLCFVILVILVGSFTPRSLVDNVVTAIGLPVDNITKAVGWSSHKRDPGIATVHAVHDEEKLAMDMTDFMTAAKACDPDFTLFQSRQMFERLDKDHDYQLNTTEFDCKTLRQYVKSFRAAAVAANFSHEIDVVYVLNVNITDAQARSAVAQANDVDESHVEVMLTVASSSAGPRLRRLSELKLWAEIQVREAADAKRIQKAAADTRRLEETLKVQGVDAPVVTVSTHPKIVEIVARTFDDGMMPAATTTILGTRPSVIGSRSAANATATTLVETTTLTVGTTTLTSTVTQALKSTTTVTRTVTSTITERTTSTSTANASSTSGIINGTSTSRLASTSSTIFFLRPVDDHSAVNEIAASTTSSVNSSMNLTEAEVETTTTTASNSTSVAFGAVWLVSDTMASYWAKTKAIVKKESKHPGVISICALALLVLLCLCLCCGCGDQDENNSAEVALDGASRGDSRTLLLDKPNVMPTEGFPEDSTMHGGAHPRDGGRSPMQTMRADRPPSRENTPRSRADYETDIRFDKTYTPKERINHGHRRGSVWGLAQLWAGFDGPPGLRCGGPSLRCGPGLQCDDFQD